MHHLLICISLISTINLWAQDKPKNIIMLIGDGMGVTQMSIPYYYRPSVPNVSRFPVVGLHNSSSAKQLITDSAAGATAFATGQRSYNGAIAVDTAENPIPTLVEILSPMGYNTAVISTSSITHATPACFYAHQRLRSMQEEIAVDLTHSEIDFFAGGGINFFALRADSLNYLDTLISVGFVLDTTSNILIDSLDPAKKYGFLNAADGLPTMTDGRGPYLQTMAKAALQYLEAKQEPFFLMIEGSQIDWAGHANDGRYMIAEMLDFDALIGDILDFAEADGETLVVTTADHETGGFTLSAKEIRMQANYNILNPTFSTGGHSACLVPVLASGPGSMAFTGVYQNIEIFHRLLQLMEITN